MLNQTYDNLELFVVDDNSPDDTALVVAGYTDDRVVYLRNGCNLGAVRGRNRVLERGHGEYVAFLDDDDAWENDKIERQVELAEGRGKDCAVIYCGAVVLTERQMIVQYLKPRMRGRIRDDVAGGLLNTIPSAHLFRASVLRDIGGYDTSLRSHNEHDIWMVMARFDLKSDYVEAPLVRVGSQLGYRMTADVDLRWSATISYFAKWRPWLQEWMGCRRARKYEQAYIVRVMSSVGRESMARHNFKALFRALFWLVSRRPGHVSPVAIVSFLFRTIAGAVLDGLRTLRSHSLFVIAKRHRL